MAVAAEVAIDGRDCSMKVSAVGMAAEVAKVEKVQVPLCSLNRFFVPAKKAGLSFEKK